VTTRTARSIAFIFLALGFSLVGLAQTTATLSGTVKNQAGTPVPGARVSLKNLSTGHVANIQADAQGNYQFEGLALGEYEISAVAEGFATKTASISISAPTKTSPKQTFDITLGTSSGPSLADLGFNTAQTQSNPEEQARLDRRTHMLKVHQKMGLITTGPLLATIISGFGAGGKRTSSGTRDFHAALGSATAGLYFTTAYFAIRAPRIQGTGTRGPIRVHKALAWIHGPGMVVTPILGAIAFDQKSKGEKVHGIASLHGPVAIITGAAYGAALLSVSVKF